MEIRMNQKGGFMPSKAMCNGRDIEGPPNMTSFCQRQKSRTKKIKLHQPQILCEL